MKLKELENYSEGRINITQVSLRLNPGQTKRVHPSLVTHPAVSPYMGNGLREVPEKTAETKVEPIAPVKETPVVPLAAPVVPPTPIIVEPEEEPVVEDNKEETDGQTLRDAFIEAPGVTDANVDAIMSVFPTFKGLASASKGVLVDIGVSKAYAKKLIDWAAEK